MSDICVNCHKRPATMDWVAEGGVMAWTHGFYVRWCDYCATEAQLAYARARAADIPALEQKLEQLKNAEA